MQIEHIPLDHIDDHAFLRDRLELDPQDLIDLQASIFTQGLHHPIELAPLDGEPPFGLISGLRRITAIRALHAEFTGPRWATIPAIIRAPASLPEALARMAAENENRAPITPWEKGHFLIRTVDTRVFDTLDAAVDGLFPYQSRQSRSRLRGWASVVQEFYGLIATPRLLTARRMDRLASACRGGLAELICDILADHRQAGLETQWQAIAPALVEAVLTEDDPEPAPNLLAPHLRPRPRPGRRRVTLPNGVKLRRELTPRGWIIRLDGASARHSAIVDDILDLVERWYREG